MGTVGQRGWGGAPWAVTTPGQVKGHGPEPVRRRKDPGPAAGQAMAGLPLFLRQHPSFHPPTPLPPPRGQALTSHSSMFFIVADARKYLTSVSSSGS